MLGTLGIQILNPCLTKSWPIMEKFTFSIQPKHNVLPHHGIPLFHGRCIVRVPAFKESQQCMRPHVIDTLQHAPDKFLESGVCFCGAFGLAFVIRSKNIPCVVPGKIGRNSRCFLHRSGDFQAQSPAIRAQVHGRIHKLPLPVERQAKMNALLAKPECRNLAVFIPCQPVVILVECVQDHAVFTSLVLQSMMPLTMVGRKNRGVMASP